MTKGNPDTRFKPGQSGNPAGRPVKEHTLTSCVQALLDNEPDKVAKGWSKKGMTGAQMAAAAIVKKLTKGDGALLKEVWDRTEGKVSQPITGAEGKPLSLTIEVVSEKAKLDDWLWRLQAVWNWAIRKIELDGRDGVRYSSMQFRNQLAGHGKKIEIPSHTIQGVLRTAHDAWMRRFKGVGGKPHLKGRRNRLNSIPFPDPIRRPQGTCLRLQGVGLVRFHKQWLPEGAIKCGRLVKRASGWHLCLFIDAEPKAIPITGDGQIGIDPGYRKESLLTLSTGEKIPHPKELERLETRLAQAQRGKRAKVAARIQERIANQRRDRNHKLSRRLVSENAVIVFSKDKIKDIAQRGRGPVHFGKHVASAAHYQLRQMLAYKCRTGGRSYIEVDGRDSTMTCSNCGGLTGPPPGLSGLAVRQWRCKGCGSLHDRDINAAINTLLVGVGATLQRGIIR